jgi:hypothetical protein
METVQVLLAEVHVDGGKVVAGSGVEAGVLVEERRSHFGVAA